MVALQNAGLFELREHAVYRGQSDIDAFVDQHAIDILGGEVSHFAGLEQLEDAQPGAGCLEADGFEVVDIRHVVCLC